MAMRMYRVMCYGDSNTWGWIPGTGLRHGDSVRWPMVLQTELAGMIWVIEEGLSGRTTAYDDPAEPQRNGSADLPGCLRSHAPLDMVILMLGTNDLKDHLDLDCLSIIKGLEKLISIVQCSHAGPSEGTPEILIVAPAPVSFTIENKNPDFTRAQTKELSLSEGYARLAHQYRCAFFNAGSVAGVSPIDGVHLDADAHAKLGKALSRELKKFLRNRSS
jgi:lysophospholipase L1-like esterase